MVEAVLLLWITAAGTRARVGPGPGAGAGEGAVQGCVMSLNASTKESFA